MRKTTNNVRLVADYDHEPCVLALKKELRRKDILKHHEFRMWQAPNGRWCSYLPEPYKNRTKKLISCRDKETLEDTIIAYYENASNPTFEEAFREWANRRLELKQIAPGTYVRNDAAFRKFFDGIKDEQLSDLEVDDYVDFMEHTIADFSLTHKAFSIVKGIVVGTLNRTKRLGQTTYSGVDVANEFKAVAEVRYRQRIYEDEDEVFSEAETALVIGKLKEHKAPMDIALLLIFATGLRVGECVALKHSDFGENYLTVRRTEIKYNLDGKQTRTVKEMPKTLAGIRTVVIPTSFLWLIDEIKKLNPDGEWVFTTNQSERMCTLTLERRLAKICDELQIPRRSPHKIRKTYCSILLDNGIDENLITQQVGHTSILTTERFYHRNRKGIERKAAILDGIDEFEACQKTY